MMQGTAMQPQSTTGYQTAGFTGAVVPFDQINQPGCYVCNWSGHLIRIPEDGLAPGRSPLVNIVGQQPLLVTKICDYPFTPVTKCRLLAANFNVNVNF